MVVKGFCQKTDDELYAMLEEIGHEPIEWTPVILAELTRRYVKRLGETAKRIADSSRRLERLTWGLIGLTILLTIVAFPPAFEAIKQFR